MSDCSIRGESEAEYRAKLIKEWRQRALTHVRPLLDHVDEDEVVVRDTIANLMHWCDERSIDFEDELRIARANFEAEIAGLE